MLIIERLSDPSCEDRRLNEEHEPGYANGAVTCKRTIMRGMPRIKSALRSGHEPRRVFSAVGSMSSAAIAAIAAVAMTLTAMATIRGRRRA
jgi:hypothetical protein